MDSNYISNLTWSDILDPEIKKNIPEFWLRFKPPPMYANYILGTIYILILIVGMVGNCTMVLLFCTTKRLRKPSNYLVINLAISDILMIHKMIIFIYNSFNGGPVAGQLWCTYYGLMGGLSGTSAIMTISMMSVERYLCVSRPLDPSCRMTKMKALLVVISVWIYAAVFSFMPLFGINRYVPEGYLTSCSFDYLSKEIVSKVFVLVFFVAAYCIPVTIICCCYIGIFMSVHQSERNFCDQMSNFNSSDVNVEKRKQIEIKLAKISLLLISLWTLSWTPYAIVALIGLFTDGFLITPLVSMLPALFCKMASTIDPFVYGFSSKQFQAEFYRKLLNLCKSKDLQVRHNMPSFIIRAIKEENISSEKADVSDSLSDDPYEETSFNGFDKTDATPKQNLNITENYLDVRSTHSLNAETQKEVRNEKERNHFNPSGVLRIHLFNIKHVEKIERNDDVIRIKSRGSF